MFVLQSGASTENQPGEDVTFLQQKSRTSAEKRLTTGGSSYINSRTSTGTQLGIDSAISSHPGSGGVVSRPFLVFRLQTFNSNGNF